MKLWVSVLQVDRWASRINGSRSGDDLIPRLIERIRENCLVTLILAIATPALAEPKDTMTLIKMWTAENYNCRGLPCDDPRSGKSCEKRKVLSKALNQYGWCRGIKTQASYEFQWNIYREGVFPTIHMHLFPQDNFEQAWCASKWADAKTVINTQRKLPKNCSQHSRAGPWFHTEGPL
jgi:hypothetical protein